MNFVVKRLAFTAILLLLSVCAGAQSKVLPDARPPGWTDTCVVFDDGTVINNIWYLRDVSPTAPFGNQNDYFEKVYQLIIRKIRISYANGDAYEGWVYVKNRAQWDSVMEGKSHCFCPILGTLYHAGSAEEQVFVAPKEMLAKKSVGSPVGRWRRVHNPGQVETLEFNANGTGVETIETRQKITIPLEGSDSRYDWWTGTRYPRQLTGGYDVNFTTRSSQTFRWERKGEYLTIKYSEVPKVITDKSLDMHSFDRYEESYRELAIRQSQQDMKSNRYVKKHVDGLTGICRTMLPEVGTAVSYQVYAFLPSGIVLKDTSRATTPDYDRGNAPFSRGFDRLSGSYHIFFSPDNRLVRSTEPLLLMYSMYELMGKSTGQDLVAVDLMKGIHKRP